MSRDDYLIQHIRETPNARIAKRPPPRANETTALLPLAGFDLREIPVGNREALRRAASWWESHLYGPGHLYVLRDWLLSERAFTPPDYWAYELHGIFSCTPFEFACDFPCRPLSRTVKYNKLEGLPQLVAYSVGYPLRRKDIQRAASAARWLVKDTRFSIWEHNPPLLASFGFLKRTAKHNAVERVTLYHAIEGDPFHTALGELWALGGDVVRSLPSQPWTPRSSHPGRMPYIGGLYPRQPLDRRRIDDLI